jgi:hypothetical protein
MNQRTRILFALEFVWWLITAVIVIALLWPIQSAGIPWVFQTQNILFVVLTITLTRYIFLHHQTFLARPQYLKAVVMLAMFPLTFVLIGEFNGFLNYIEENTWEPLTGHLAYARRRGLESFIWNEMLFFGAASVIAAPAFAVRMFVSIWRQHNLAKRDFRGDVRV